MSDNRWALVVEDDAHSLVAIGAILRDLGIYYKRNTTGSDVPGHVAGMEPKPDFILLDMDLPHGDSIDILHTLRANPFLACIPVIAIANNIDGAMVALVREAGFAGLVAKPLPRRHFGDMVQRVIAGEHVWQIPV